MSQLERIDQIITEKGLWIVNDDALLDAAMTEVLANNPKAVADFKAGNEKAVGRLIGQVVKQIKGADPAVVSAKLLTLLRAT